MNIQDVKVITVVGAVNMGRQIGTLCAMHGCKTYVTDANPAQLEKAKNFLEEYLPGRVAKGCVTQEEAKKDERGLPPFQFQIQKKGVLPTIRLPAGAIKVAPVFCRGNWIWTLIYIFCHFNSYFA